MSKLTRRGALLAMGGALAGCPGGPDGRGTARGSDRQSYDLSLAHDHTDWDRYDPDWTAPSEPAPASVGVETVVENLEIPWDLSFTSDGSEFISERTGRILQYDGGDLRAVAEPADLIDAGSVPTSKKEVVWWVDGGEGGLLGIAAHPGYPEPPIVYAYYTDKADGERLNELVYVDVSADDSASESVVLIDGIPGARYHDGSRITVGPANYLWVTTGDGVPGWRHRLLVAALASQEDRVVTIAESEAALPSGPSVDRYHEDWVDDRYAVASQPAMTDELGRIRHLEQGPDGTLYAITSIRDGRSGEGFPREGDDRLVRLTGA